MRTVSREDLGTSDLFVDCLYEGGRGGNAGDDPIHRLLPVSNQGGFRIVGTREEPRLIVLITSLGDPDWPDEINKEVGEVTYFGDNKQPGGDLHGTPRYGNVLLRDLFQRAHAGTDGRRRVPPILLFAKAGSWRDVVFMGLAVPGGQSLGADSDLVAVWKLRDGSRFQNYRAKLTIVDVSSVSREWIEQVVVGNSLGHECPDAWRAWVEARIFSPLKAARTLQHRTREEQLPADPLGIALVRKVRDRFREEPVRFEACAARLAEMMLPAISGSVDLTRASRDGGRDAVGHYRIGEGPSAVLVEFALEAKCYTEKSVGVKELSRLISRLRHRQFGVLVTTTYVASQAYQEIKEDQHPIVIISAVDIARLLIRGGIKSVDEVDAWLSDF